jgi:hypothetical protein
MSSAVGRSGRKIFFFSPPEPRTKFVCGSYLEEGTTLQALMHRVLDTALQSRASGAPSPPTAHI